MIENDSRQDARIFQALVKKPAKKYLELLCSVLRINN